MSTRRKINYELSPLPAYPRLDPVILRLDHPLVDHYARDPVHIFSELCFVGRIGCRIIFGLHRRGNVDKDEERVEME